MSLGGILLFFEPFSFTSVLSEKKIISMKKNQLQASIAIFVIALPVIVYFIFKGFSTAHFNNMPYQYSVSASGDTLIHTLPDFELTDQNGQPFSRKDMLGKVYIVSFFDGMEEEHVPDKKDRYNFILMPNLAKVYRNADDAPMVRLLSISTSPETDSLPVLQDWANRFEAEAPRWTFASGNRDEVFKLGLETFRMKEFMKRMRREEPFTARAIALVDKEGKVRRYYEGTNDFAIEKQLFEDLRALLTIEYEEDFSKKEDG
jgi:protein SCO1/2